MFHSSPIQCPRNILIISSSKKLLIMTSAQSRQPASIERYFLGRVAEGIYTNYQVAAQYSLPIDKLLLSNALKELIPKFQTLQIGVEKMPGSEEDGNYKDYNLAPVDQVIFDDVVEISSEEYNLPYIQKKSCPLSASVPTWRVILFSDNYISFYNNHILFDGVASVNFHKELCKIFNSLSGIENLSFQSLLFELKDSEPHAAVSHAAVSELVDDYTPSLYKIVTSVSFHLLPKAISELISYYWSSYYPNYLKFPFIDKALVRNVDILYLTLKVPSAKLNKILTLCRNNQISLTSFLVVLLNYCLQEVIISKLSSSPMSTKTFVPMNGRRYHPDLEKALTFANFVSGFAVPLEPLTSLDEKQLIDNSKIVNSNIKQQIETRDPFKTFGLLGYVNIRDFLNIGLEEVHSDGFFEVSNVGFHDIVEGDWKVKDLQFSQGGWTGCFITASVAATPEGLNICLDYKDELSAAQKARLEKLFYVLIDTFAG